MNQSLRKKQQIVFQIVDTFIRIPLSGILIKFLSLRSLRLCGEIVFGQECVFISIDIAANNRCEESAAEFASGLIFLVRSISDFSCASLQFYIILRIVYPFVFSLNMTFRYNLILFSFLYNFDTYSPALAHFPLPLKLHNLFH